MKVLVVGAGNMGTGFVKQLVAAGHEVTVTSKTAAKAAALAGQYPGARSALLDQAAEGQDVIVLATPYSEATNALLALGSLKGKVVIDISNPLAPDYMGLTIGHATSAAEEIARAAPDAVLVKGFNTVFAQVLAAGADLGAGQTVNVFLASDDGEAKKIATALAQSMGFKVVDAGGLKNARYGAGLGTAMAPAWIHRELIADPRR